MNTAASRIVSLVPSITELLYDLGLAEQVVGINRFCILPEHKPNQPQKVGGTKDFNISTIRQLQPTIILANKEENDRVLIEKLSTEFHVLVTDIKTVKDALDMIHTIGELFDVTDKCRLIIDSIQQSLVMPKEFKKAIYLIWNNPIMTIGGDTFISDMMKYAGFDNVYKTVDRYPVISEQDIDEQCPDFLLLSSEPYAFREHHIRHYQARFPNVKVIAVDGQIFSWYGSRMQMAGAYFKQLKLS